MSKQTAVRIKGSPWQALLHRSTRDARLPTQNGVPQVPVSDIGQRDMLLDLAVRHFADARLTSNGTRKVAAALEQVVSTGRSVTVIPAGTAERPYRISRRLAAVTIQVDGQQIRLPLRAARQLADALGRTNKPGRLQDLAA